MSYFRRNILSSTRIFCRLNSQRIMSTVQAPKYASRLKGFDSPTVWQEFTPLANQYKSENLGQGFPDWETPEFVKKSMDRAIAGNFNQYCRSAGEPALVEAVAKFYGPLVGREIDPLTEVTTSVGATEALFAIMQSLIDPGDQVLVLEPAFDIYTAQVQMAGGSCNFVTLQLDKSTKKWELDLAEFEAAITPKTKIILLNNPHNPTGKVFTMEEMQGLADIVLRNPHVTVVTDEVYENLVYDGKQHIRLCSLPGMWDRVLTVSSSGKTFSCTGWKVGWVYGASHLIKPVMLANQWVQFSVSTPTQRALAEVINEATEPYEGFPSYYHYVNNLYQTKRDRLARALEAARMTPYVPDAGFFIIADTSAIEFPPSHMDEPGPDGTSPVSRDWGFARWLTKDIGVTPIPPSAFYTPEHRHFASNMARFAFCKTDECIEAAAVKLIKLG